MATETDPFHFARSRKRPRVRYDRIAAFDTYENGFGIMWDAQTARPQAFWTGGDRFAYDLAANLAQVQG